MNCLSLIQQRYPEMSPVEKRIADCILADPKKIMNSTVVYISATAGVSEGSVINFSNSLGFKGFSQLKINLAQNISAFNTQDEINEDDTPKQIMRKIIDRAVASFESTYESMENEVEEAAKLLLKASRILVVGVGHSIAIARDLSIRLMRIGLPAYTEEDILLAGISISQMSEDDVVFAISNSGRTKEVLNVVQVANNVGAKVISLTSHNPSPLTRMSDITLVSVSLEAKDYREPTTARLTQLLLGDCLVDCIIHQNSDKSIIHLDKMVEIYEQHRESIS